MSVSLSKGGTREDKGPALFYLIKDLSSSDVQTLTHTHKTLYVYYFRYNIG